MRISKDTLNELSERGISVRWYPEATFEEFKKRVWQQEYDYAFNYGKDHVAGSKAVLEGTANELYSSMEEFEKSCRYFANGVYLRSCSAYEYKTLYITYDNGNKTFLKKENIKSKEITVDYILKLIERNEKAYTGTFGKFAISMQKLLKETGLDTRYSIYPTTYGIGVWVFYNFSADEDMKQVMKILDSRGIEYSNEYSEAGWVYRYKVSKGKTNLEKINL